MRFIAPRVFYLVLVVLAFALALLLRSALRRRKELDKVLSPLRPRDAALLLSPAARFLRYAGLLAAFVLIGFAAARPYWSSKLLPTTERGRDVAVIFDVSKSMLAKDIAPSRLEHAKFLLREIARKSPGDRFGLIAFAGKAYTACPLTADPVAFDEYINELSPDLVPLGGTNLELALREALRLFEGAGGERAVVVLTDGDELSGSASAVAAELKEKRIPLFVIGLGDPAVPAPLPDEAGHLRRDRAGKIITSKLNEAALQKLAQATGGIYVRSTVTDTGAGVVASHIAALGKNVYGGGKRSTPEEKFPYFILGALVLLGFFLALPERRARRMSMLLFGFLTLTTVSAGPPPPPTPGAEKLPAAQSEKLPSAPAELYNLGVAKQNAGDPETAKQCYEKVLKHRPPEEKLRMKSLFNLGVEEHRQGRDKLAAARTQVQSQQLDKSLEELEAARRRTEAAGELYSRALGAAASAAVEDAAATDLQLLERDRKAIDELKKQIEELKKQQQKARQSAQNAQQQNQQQKQQNQQQNQQKQDQQQQNQQQKQGQQQQQQQSQQPQSAAGSAQRESEKLREQAEKLGQKELEKHAANAADELKKAQEEQKKGDREQAQKHLDNAVRELGSDKPDKPDKQNQPDKPGDDRSGEKKDEQKSGAPAPQEPKPQADDRKGAEQLLKLLNDEEKQRRGELHKVRDARRPQVEKDW